VLHFL